MCIHVCIHVCVCTYVCVYVCVCVLICAFGVCLYVLCVCTHKHTLISYGGGFSVTLIFCLAGDFDLSLCLPS